MHPMTTKKVMRVICQCIRIARYCFFFLDVGLFLLCEFDVIANDCYSSIQYVKISPPLLGCVPFYTSPTQSIQLTSAISSRAQGALPPLNTYESGAPLKFRHSFPDICSIAKMTRLQELYLKQFGRLKWFDIVIFWFICLRCPCASTATVVVAAPSLVHSESLCIVSSSNQCISQL